MWGEEGGAISHDANLSQSGLAWKIGDQLRPVVRIQIPVT